MATLREHPGAGANTAGQESGKPASPPPFTSYTRDGFSGGFSVGVGLSYGPDFIKATGPHVPRRMLLERFVSEDASDPEASPSLLASSRAGLRIYVSRRTARMPFVVRNIDADELHFIQEGEVLFETDVGQLRAGKGDFVCIPRAVAYRFSPLNGSMLSLIIEVPSELQFDTPYAFGTINFGRDLERARAVPADEPGGVTRLVLKSVEDGVTTFMLPTDPLVLRANLGGEVPVWRLPLNKIQKVTSLPEGGPPLPFLSSKGGEMIAFNMGDRPTANYRPPIHVNADFDEFLLFVDGPGSWGGVTEPGTLAWVPKGVVHHGVAPCSPVPYSSWGFETRATMRWSEAAIAASEIMETGTYGAHPSVEAL